MDFYINENEIVTSLTSVFPSSTGPNLLSLSTGTWPGSHGDLGWETYLNQISDSSTLIKWERSKDKKKLSDLGLNLEEVYLEKSLLSDYKINFSFMVPHEYKDVPLLNWISNGKILPYKNIFDSLSFCIDRIKTTLLLRIVNLELRKTQQSRLTVPKPIRLVGFGTLGLAKLSQNWLS